MLIFLLNCFQTVSLSSTEKIICNQTVDDDKWSELFPFLSDSESREDICRVVTEDGEYTGLLDDDGERHGWGEMRWRNGTLYGSELQFYYSDCDRYLGQWSRGQQEGVGTLYSRTGVYVGAWSQGLQNGNGTAMYNNGNRYSGMFRDGFKDGRGVFSVSNGDVYSGDFRRGERDGHGIETFYTGERYVGQYSGDQRHGHGTAYYNTGQVKYTGQWVEGSPHGNGTYLALNGDRYVGGFRRGVIVGPGTIYEVNGNIRFVQDNESIEFRNASNKYLDLIQTVIEFLGLGDFLQKYRTFYNDFIWPNLPG